VERREIFASSKSHRKLLRWKKPHKQAKHKGLKPCRAEYLEIWSSLKTHELYHIFGDSKPSLRIPDIRIKERWNDKNISCLLLREEVVFGETSLNIASFFLARLFACSCHFFLFILRKKLAPDPYRLLLNWKLTVYGQTSPPMAVPNIYLDKKLWYFCLVKIP